MEAIKDHSHVLLFVFQRFPTIELWHSPEQSELTVQDEMPRWREFPPGLCALPFPGDQITCRDINNSL